MQLIVPPVLLNLTSPPDKPNDQADDREEQDSRDADRQDDTHAAIPHSQISSSAAATASSTLRIILDLWKCPLGPVTHRALPCTAALGALDPVL